MAVSNTPFSRVSLFLAFAGWVLMLAGTAHVYHTFLSPDLGIDQVLFPYGMLSNPSLTETKTTRIRTRGQNHTTDTTTSTELNDSELRSLNLMNGWWGGSAWYINDADNLVEGYMWWIVAFQLFGIIYSVASERKLAPLCMHVVLTASTFIYTRTVLSGYIFCLMRTVENKHRPKFNNRAYNDVTEAVKTGLAIVFAGCIIVDVANVMIVHARAGEAEISLIADGRGPA